MSEHKKDLMEWFRDCGFDQYGAVMPHKALLDYLGIEVPRYGTWWDFKRIELELLDPVRHIRDTLLDEGKYLKKEKDVYRVLLPSENAAQIRSFEESADKKLRRAARLSRTTPVDHKDLYDTTEIRLRMKQESIRDSRLYGCVPASA